MEDITILQILPVIHQFCINLTLQRSKNDFIQYKNKIFPNNSHKHLIACDSASIIVLQIYKINFIEYNNQNFPNNAHIHLRDFDAASSYHFPSPINGSNIPKRDLILNFCYYCLRMNNGYLE